MSEEKFEIETWERTKKKYNLVPCPDCESIKKDVLRKKEHRCMYCMFYWEGRYAMEEETITGEAAIRLRRMLDDPEKYNPKWKEQQKRIKEALEQFPNPTEPTELDIDLTDNIEDE